MKTAIRYSSRLIVAAFCGLFVIVDIHLLPTNAVDCHDDPSLEITEGLLRIVDFTWFGSLQYIHVKTGSPHYFRVPRVVLIHKQFAISTALDAADVPDEYALGNVVFGEYEKDETECTLTERQRLHGVKCKPSVMLMPISDVLVHPEFKHFKVKHSVALLKLLTAVRSSYLLPACLPLIDYVALDANDTLKPTMFYHLDFVSSAPREFSGERKIITELDIFLRDVDPREFFEYKEDSNKTVDFRAGRSMGCGIRSGAPTMVHEHTGHWTVVALAHGGPPCNDPLRQHTRYGEAGHTLLQPYVTWISRAIAGRSSASMTMEDPFGVVMPRSTDLQKVLHSFGFVGKWWMGGIRCYHRGVHALEYFRFYHEQFIIEPNLRSAVTYRLEINAPQSHNIICVKVGVPHKLSMPRIWDIGSSAVKLEMILPLVTRRLVLEVEGYADPLERDKGKEAG